MGINVLKYNKGGKDCSVETFDTMAVAEKSAAEHEGKDDGFVVTGEDSFKHLSMHEQLELYGGLNGSAPSRFKDLETGARRLFACVKGIAAQQNQAESTEQPTNGEEGELPKAAKKKTVKKAAVKKAATGSRVRIDRNKKIYKLVDHNPRTKKTSQGYKSWEIITQGMKVETYLAKGGRVQDLSWDLERKWIELRD